MALAEEPSPLALLSSSPNPLNPEATISFEVQEAQQVQLAVFKTERWAGVSDLDSLL